MPNCPRRGFPLFTTNLSVLTTNWPDLCHSLWTVYILNKNGAKRSSSWPGTPFWPISLWKNQQKGCQKGRNTKFNQIRFSASQTIHHHKRNTPVVFWGEKRPWVERGGSLRKYSVPKNELLCCPDHWGGPFGPKLCEPFTYVILIWCASKKSHFQTFTQLTPSGVMDCSVQQHGQIFWIHWRWRIAGMLSQSRFNRHNWTPLKRWNYGAALNWQSPAILP